MILDNTISFTMGQQKQDWFEVAKILGVFTEHNGESGIQKINGINYEYRSKEENLS